METAFRVEPLLIEDGTPDTLADLLADVESEAGSLGRGLSPILLDGLADLIRIVDCHHSNLIEGHAARPKDIERALAGLSLDPERRSLALEARAHVLVHRRIDEAFHAGTLASPTSVAFLTWVHEAFYTEVPEDLRVVRHPDGSTRHVVPGRFRGDPREDVAVGRHLPPSSTRVGDFMRHFEARYGQAERGSASGIMAIAAAHHRFNFIHPFLDGNGRVSRLMSHAMALRAGIGGSGLWSISRGFALGLAGAGDYLRMMDMADAVRQGSRDGRGNLSQARLVDFCEWASRVMLEQIRFARATFEPETLERRGRALLKSLGYDEEARELWSNVFRRGEVKPGEVSPVPGVPGEIATPSASRLASSGFLRSRTAEGPIGIAFPIEHRAFLFPGLFADEPMRLDEVPVPGLGS